jgi:hypothetical protein
MYLASEDLSVTTAPALAPYSELAKALRRGAKRVTPKQGEYGARRGFFRRWHGCALCAIAVGLNMPAGFEALNSFGLTRQYLNEIWGPGVIDEIEAEFEVYDMSFEEIADGLELM